MYGEGDDEHRAPPAARPTSRSARWPRSVQQVRRRLHGLPVTVATVICSFNTDHGVAGPRAWNNLPVNLRLSRTFSTFKTHPKSHLFNISFPSVWLYHWLFLYRALETACAAYASLNLSLLHYITLHYDDIKICNCWKLPSDCSRRRVDETRRTPGVFRQRVKPFKSSSLYAGLKSKVVLWRWENPWENPHMTSSYDVIMTSSYE